LRIAATGCAVEIDMAPQFTDAGQLVQHPLEKLFNATGWDILSAIERGFRAQVDVKGKLAEYFLFKKLEALLNSGAISLLEWHDKDGVPDFSMTYREVMLRVECKNIRSPARKAKPTKRKPKADVQPPVWKVEIQKTRNQLTGGPARGYKADEFEILAVCLFNQNGKWDFLFIQTANLLRRPDHPDYLTIMQPVPVAAQGHWKASIEEVIHQLVEP
jgi:hypothetical protein